MGKTSTSRYARRATSTPQRGTEYSLLDDDASTVAAESSPAPAGSNDQPRLRKGGHQPSHTPDVQEREGQGLCVFVDGTWRPAVWHHQVVTGLEKEEYGAHLYDIEPPRRNDSQPAADITTFLARQKTWNFESKEHRPGILFQLYASDDFHEARSVSVQLLEYDMDGTVRVVVDIFSQRPLRDFKNIPLQLATNVEGGRLEAMCREDCRINTTDYLQRMIPLLDGNGEVQRDEKGVVLCQRPLRNALNSLKTNFRNRFRCVSWQKNNHDSEFDKQLLQEISEEDKAANSTRDLPDLSLIQVTAVRSLAKSRRKDSADGKGNGHAEVAVEGKPGATSAEDAGNQGTVKLQDGGGERAVVDDGDIQNYPPLAPDLISEPVIDTGGVAKEPRRQRRSTKGAGDAGNVAPAPPSANYGSLDVIDPALINQSTSSAVTEEHNGFKSPEVSCPPTDDTKAISPLAAASGIANDDSGRHEPTLKRKLTDELTNSDHDTAQNGGFPYESDVTPSSSKRARILPPISDCHQMLKDFTAQTRPVSAPGSLANGPKPGPFYHKSARPLQQRSESPQSSAPGSLVRLPSEAAPPVQPNGYSSNRIQGHDYLKSGSVAPVLTQHAPFLPRPYTTNQIQSYDHAQILQAEQAHFATISHQTSTLETIKCNLLTSWWNSQPDTSSGGGLYGPILSIPLSHLGPTSSHRTDAEVRALLTAYQIPPTWSASSIDLRMHTALRQAVHAALSNAERWDRRNYRVDFGQYLDLNREGGFFLATAQPGTIHEGDSRFMAFGSQKALNASLHTALWRYKQLTGRDFAGRRTVGGGEGDGMRFRWRVGCVIMMRGVRYGGRCFCRIS